MFVIPYFVSFVWVDDKRKTYIKSEQMYPELTHSPSPNKQVFEPAKDIEIEKQPHSPELKNKNNDYSLEFDKGRSEPKIQ